MTRSDKNSGQDRPKCEPKGDYDVGYCRPPVSGQFKSGQSGNPDGRKKGTNNFATDVKRSLNTPVEIMRDGKLQKISSQEAGVMRLREKALKGDAKSLDRYLDLAQQYNNEALEQAMEDAGVDADIVNVFAERVRSGAFGAPDETASPDADAPDADAPDGERS